MNENSSYAIGLMSGTSLDGLDIVYVAFDSSSKKKYQIIHAQTVSYSPTWISLLRDAFQKEHPELKTLSRAYAELMANEVLRFIQTHSITRIDFIASHGHTVFHKPHEGVTLQIGEGQVLADLTGIEVVCDFRSQDVALGGQGAPLVPIGDALLFGEYDACLNLGGFANVSYTQNNERIAFDICAVNTVLNTWALLEGFPYDDQGNFAKEGNLNDSLLEALNKIDFYKQSPPKSLGIEWVHEVIFPITSTYAIATHDLLRTYVEHIAIQIGKTLASSTQTLVTGGGAFNTFLMQRIKAHTKGQLTIPDEDLIHYKEALVFAFLGFLKRKGEINCLKSVTGAQKNHSSGVIFTPQNLSNKDLFL